MSGPTPAFQKKGELGTKTAGLPGPLLEWVLVLEVALELSLQGLAAQCSAPGDGGELHFGGRREACEQGQV